MENNSKGAAIIEVHHDHDPRHVPADALPSDMADLKDLRITMQPRCPHCLTEQWAPIVYKFSHGECDCAWCGKKTKPMTDAEYLAALKEAKVQYGL